MGVRLRNSKRHLPSQGMALARLHRAPATSPTYECPRLRDGLPGDDEEKDGKLIGPGSTARPTRAKSSARVGAGDEGCPPSNQLRRGAPKVLAAYSAAMGR